MASQPRIHIYRTYRFIDKDPIIDAARIIRQEASRSDREAHELSGVATATVHNWFDGGTRNPRHSTMTAYASSYGYVRRDRLRRDGTVEVAFARVKDINVEREIEKQADWILTQDRKSKRREKKK